MTLVLLLNNIRKEGVTMNSILNPVFEYVVYTLLIVNLFFNNSILTSIGLIGLVISILLIKIGYDIRKLNKGE